ncbi:hypothetical protein ACFXGA_18735 [Actinosynnema sp. NPDC059335]|uniref:hypothetical protein n=1 Tax=Actinosynnema sp. NPDC059335 TaxID=3346804 RepID=UPI00366B8AE7
MEIVEPAGTTDDDWVGTAGAEDSVIKGSGSLYELSGLDVNRWSILAVDASAYSHGAEPEWTVHVYAVDRQAEEVKSYEDLAALAARRGSVPVKEVLVHNVSFDDVIKCMKVVHVQLISPNFPKLDVVERGDHPAQD